MHWSILCTFTFLGQLFCYKSSAINLTFFQEKEMTVKPNTTENCSACPLALYSLSQSHSRFCFSEMSFVCSQFFSYLVNFTCFVLCIRSVRWTWLAARTKLQLLWERSLMMSGFRISPSSRLVFSSRRIYFMYFSFYKYVDIRWCFKFLFPVVQICALRITDGARCRIIKAGGQVMTFDQLALASPKGHGTVLLSGNSAFHFSLRIFELLKCFH